MYHSIFKRCVTDQPIQFKPLIHIVGDFVFYDVTVKSNHIAVLPSLSVSSAQPLSKLNARADFPGIGYALHRSSHLLGLQFREVFYTVTNIRTPQRTVSSMQRFAVSQKNRTEAITISPFSLSLLFSAKNRRHPTEVECRLFCCPILLSRCRFCSFLKLLSYRHTAKAVLFHTISDIQTPDRTY